jgi:hypothetical protein
VRPGRDDPFVILQTTRVRIFSHSISNVGLQERIVENAIRFSYEPASLGRLITDVIWIL